MDNGLVSNLKSNYHLKEYSKTIASPTTTGLVIFYLFWEIYELR